MEEEKEEEIKEEVKTETKSNKKIICIILVVIGVVLAFIGGYFVSNAVNNNNKEEQKEEKKEEQKQENDNGPSVVIEKKELTKEEVLDNYNNNSHKYDEVSVMDETIIKLFNIYHQISVVSKEQIVLQQISKSDVIEVNCDFIDTEKLRSAVLNNAEFIWCGSLNDEIETAWANKNADRVIELIKKNKTEAVKTEVLQNKFKELFGETTLKDVIYLQREPSSESKWYNEIFGAFVEFEKVNGKDYYARISYAGGDPGDYSEYELKAAYDTGYLYLVYSVIPQGVGEESIHVMMFDKDPNGNYVFVKDM